LANRLQTGSLDGSCYNGEEERALGETPRGATPGNLRNGLAPHERLALKTLPKALIHRNALPRLHKQNSEVLINVAKQLREILLSTVFCTLRLAR